MIKGINNLVTFSSSDIGIDPSNINNRIIKKEDFDSETIEWLKKYHNKNDNESIINQALEAQKEINFETLFEELKNYAEQRLNVTLPLHLLTIDDTINISQNENSVFINSIMSSAYFSYIATQMYHADTIGNEQEDLFCYRYTLSILNNMCYGDFKLPILIHDKDKAHQLLEKFLDKKHLLNLCTDIYYSSLAFALLHEIAHAYHEHIAGQYNLNKEIEADKTAYMLYLNFCDDIYNKKIDSSFEECIQPHTYMAPMYLLEFYYVVYYTGSLLCLNLPPVEKQFFDDIVTRKNHMLEVFYAWEGGENEQPSYDLYRFYLNGQESFLRSFIASDKEGKLDSIKKDNWENSTI